MALTSSEILLIIKAKDQASAVLDKIGSSGNAMTKTLSLAGKVGVGAIAGITAAAVAGGVGLLAYGVHAAKAAGRVDELAIVNKVLAQNAGIAHDEMRAAVAAVKAKGIEAAASEGAVAKLIQAELDLSKASDLARVAQDAAVISNSNSTEAYDALIHGITTMNPLVLRNQGIIINADEAYAAYAETLGKTAKELTSTEKQAAFLHSTLRAGQRIAGSYDAAMKNPIKQLGSMKRLFNELAVGVGEPFLNVFSKIIAKMSDWLKVLGAAVQEGGKLRPTLDLIARGMEMLLSVGSQVFDGITGGFEGLVNIISDLAFGWTGDVLALIARAANWGANIVESFAAGIQGSGAVTDALRNIGNTITTWLMPGSPPKLLPHLDTWGMGAAEAWLSGWAMASGKAGPFLSKLRKNIGGFLESIHAGQDISPESIAEKFGADAPLMKRYLGSYRGVTKAVSEVAAAKEALAKAEEEGDEEAIEAAKERLAVAEGEEKSARKIMRTQEQALTKRLQQEQKVADAIIQRAEVEVKAARDSEALAEEARQRAIAQAYLQYRLAVAGTAAAQIPIWEEELAKVEHGTAEFWQIQTRLVELRRSAEKAAQGVGAGVGTGISDGIRDGVEEGSKDGKAYADSGAHVEQGLGKIDWAGIGKVIAGSLVAGMIEGIKAIPGKILEWSISFRQWAEGAAAEGTFSPVGVSIGQKVGNGILLFFGLDSTSENVGQGILGMLARAAYNIGAAAWTLGVSVAYQFLRGMTASLAGLDMKEFEKLEQAAREHPQMFRHQRPLGENANGTDWWRGGLSLVGERGPELVNLPRGSQVHTARETEGMMGSTYNVTVNIAGNANRRDVEIGVIQGLRAVGIGV